MEKLLYRRSPSMAVSGRLIKRNGARPAVQSVLLYSFHMAVIFTMAVIVAAAQDATPTKPKPERHLERITWDIKTKVLTAVVSDGRMVPTKEDAKKLAYQPETITDYQIDLSQAHITVNGEREEFGHYEAELMWRVVDLIAQYAGESVLFFDDTHESNDKKPKQEAKR